MKRDDLIGQIEFLRDIGVESIAAPKRTAAPVRKVAESGALPSSPSAPRAAAPATPPRPATPAPSVEASPVASPKLAAIRDDLGDCQRCKLASTRTNIVFGSGNPDAELVFVGEAPGSDEDKQGLPFVGRAGQLLTKIIESIDLRREDVYICNIIKCRPPENRNPELDEITQCSPFMHRQLAAIRPKIVCCLGTFAAQTVLSSTMPISKLRGEFHDRNGLRVLATFHPAYLLRNPEKKRDVWEDMKRIRAELVRLRT